MSDFSTMTADQILIFLTDLVVSNGSVSGEIRFGTDDEELLEFNDRINRRNEEFTDLLNRVQQLTARNFQPDPREVRKQEMKRSDAQRMQRRLAEIDAQVQS